MTSSGIARPQTEIDNEIKELISLQSERCTIVHCRFYVTELAAVRIWPSTFLIEDSGRKCRLIKTFNISLMPEWTQYFAADEFIRFTLVFEGLSKGCQTFHLLEDIPEEFAFHSKEISRNSMDVYFTEVFC
ncbi:MAG: hypothetical protein ABI237_05175 [Ginsengibacter sp.]